MRDASHIPGRRQGAARAGAKDFAQFVNVAVGSCEEVHDQLHLAEALGHLMKAEQQALDGRYESVKEMLARLFVAVSRKRTAEMRQIAATDKSIDALVDELYGLTDKRTAAVEDPSRV